MYEFMWLSKGQWELIYYVFFVVLTALIVFIALKTYVFQRKKESKSEIFCKCVESKFTTSIDTNVFLEIYNYGNGISRNIKVKLQDRDFGTIPFLRPNESYLLCFGYSRLHGGKHIEDISGNLVKVTLDVNGKIQEHEIDVSILENAVSIR